MTLGKEIQWASPWCRDEDCGVWHSCPLFSVGSSRPILVMCVGKGVGLYPVYTIAIDLVCYETMVRGAGGDSEMWSGGEGTQYVTNVAI